MSLVLLLRRSLQERFVSIFHKYFLPMHVYVLVLMLVVLPHTIICRLLHAMRSRTVSASVKQQREHAHSQALCLPSAPPFQGRNNPNIRQMMNFWMQSMQAVMSQGLDDEDTDSPPSRRGANIHILKPKAKQTPSPSPPASASPEPTALFSKVGGSSFPALGNAVPAEESTSGDLEQAAPHGARKDEEANPSEFAHERKSALRKPVGSSDVTLSPNRVRLDPQIHAAELAGAMKEILSLVLYLTRLGLLFWIVCLSLHRYEHSFCIY